MAMMTEQEVLLYLNTKIWIIETMSIVTIIIEQHADEASFNWLIRGKAIKAPHYKLADLAELDTFIEANIDGLRIAKDEGWQICCKLLSTQDPGDIFTAAVLAFESQDQTRMDDLFKTAEPKADLWPAVISALGWINFDRIAPLVQKMLSSETLFLRYIGLGGCAVHRKPALVDLRQFLSDENSLMRARAVKAIGELGQKELVPAILPLLEDDDETCRFYTAWSAGLMGFPEAVEALKSITMTSSIHRRASCDLLTRILEPQNARKWLDDLFQDDEMRQTAIRGYGTLGLPQAVPLLIESISDPVLARSAGESISIISGLDIEYDSLDQDPPQEFALETLAYPDDDQTTLDEDDRLPWPSMELIKQWWQANQTAYTPDTRYLCGRPITRDQCRNILMNGFQRQRIAAALELALATPGQALFEVRAPGFIQPHHV